MPKTTWSPGQKVNAAFLNALQNLVFDDQDLDGHYTRLTDDALSGLPGNIKPQWQAFRDEFRVSSTSGLIASVAGGLAILESGDPIAVSPASIACLSSATSYVSISATGTIVNSLTVPIHGLPLARVVASANAIVSIEDLRSRFRVMPRANAIRTFGGAGQDGSFNLSTGTTTLTAGEYFFTDFTIAAGATLLTKGAIKIFCSGRVNIDGTIVNSPAVSGGGAFAGVFLGPSGIISSPAAGRGLGGAGDVNLGSEEPYSYTTYSMGSGGAGTTFELYAQPSGFGTRTGWFYSTRGGRGGSSIEIESAGAITIGGSLSVNGETGSDGKTGFLGWETGAGGGSGGLIHLKSLTSVTLSASSMLSARGGDGGFGFKSDGDPIARSGGGGGGWIVVNAPQIQTAGSTLLVTGGASSPLVANTWAGVSGGSYAGAGGTWGQNGSVGSIVIRVGEPL